MRCRENPGQTKRENPHKVHVEVIIHSALDGTLEPLKFRTEYGNIYRISSFENSQPAASQKAGGIGIRYTCRVDICTNDNEIFERGIDLYHDGDFWYVEREQLQELLPDAQNS